MLVMQMMISKGKAKFEFLAAVPGTQMFPCYNTGVYLHENIKADGKIYIVCVGKRVIQDPFSVVRWELHSTNLLHLQGCITPVLQMPLLWRFKWPLEREA